MRFIWSTVVLQMKNSFSRPTFKYVIVIQPVFFAMITYMIYKDSSIENFLNYVVLGSGLLSLWSAIIFSSAGDIERERFMGNLELISVTSTPFYKILIGKVIGNTLIGVLSIGITFLFVTVFFGERMVIKHPFIFLVGFILMVISFMNLSMILAIIFTMSRSSRGLMNCLEYPIYILTGMVFPLSIIPTYLLPISSLLSPTWAVQILHLAINGTASYNEFLFPLLALTALCIVYYFISVLLLKICQQKTRQNGTLGVY